MPTEAPRLGQFTAMISSTTLDLPEHRQQAMGACLREGVFPLAIEHRSAADSNAQAASLQMVDKADLYIGIFAHRYGEILPARYSGSDLRLLLPLGSEERAISPRGKRGKRAGGDQ